jgi:uncharacterized membrane protein YbjE (DUF340 family)
MLAIIIILASGLLLGRLLRKTSIPKNIGFVVNLTLMLLLFSLGISVGSNDEVLKNFPIIGMDALILSLAAILGSILCGKFVYNKFFRNKSDK